MLLQSEESDEVMHVGDIALINGAIKAENEL